MASLENLPADQRAVLQLVLQRGRGYDEIARLLSMDRAAVRERALNAFDALGPQTGVGDQRRALITDYLLGQLPPRVAAEVRDHLAQAPGERAWARVLASEIAPLTARALPEIPTEASRAAPSGDASPQPAAAAGAPASGKKQRESVLLRRRRRKQAEAAGATAAGAAAGGAAAGDGAAGSGTTPSPSAGPPSAPSASGGSSTAPSPKDEKRSRRGRRGRRPVAVAPDDEESPRRSSRVGGAILIAVGVLAVIAVVAVIANQSSNTNTNKPASSAAAPAAGAASASASGSATTGTTTSGAATGAKLVGQVNLKPTAKGSKAAGIAEVLKEGSSNGIAIVAQNVPANTKKPPNAYAVWLYNSAADAYFLGFVNPGVGANGKLSTAGGLPATASHYHQLIITVETVAHPKQPGTILLAGPLSGL